MSYNPNLQIEFSQAAVSTMSRYPPATQRRDISANEWIIYKNAWTTFQNIWMYNYTVSTINGTAGMSSSNLRPWQYLSYSERGNYLNGQQAINAYYSNAPANQFKSVE